MSLIYIRHADDENVTSDYSNDPGISEESREKISKLTKRLIKKYGQPDLVLVSPMSRTLETYREMSPHLEEHRMAIDKNLSRLFTSDEMKKTKISELHPKTLYHGIPIGETKKQFNARVEYQFKKVRRHSNLNIWCLTHTLVIKKVAKICQAELPDRLNFLETLILISGKN